MKVVNDLLGYRKLKIIQDTEWFSFSLDSVLLPNFVTLNKNIKNVLDLGTGNAPIPLILSTKVNMNTTIYGIEIQKEISNMASESVKMNALENAIKIINDDMKNLDKYFNINFFDVVVTNPPFFKVNENSKYNDMFQKTIARHEVSINLEEIISISSKFLKNNGVFAMVHRTDRLIEIISVMKKYKIEPKRIQLIYPKDNAESNILLIEGRKNGNSGLKVLPPIFAHDKYGNYTEIIKNNFK